MYLDVFFLCYGIKIRLCFSVDCLSFSCFHRSLMSNRIVSREMSCLALVFSHFGLDFQLIACINWI